MKSLASKSTQSQRKIVFDRVEIEKDDSLDDVMTRGRELIKPHFEAGAHVIFQIEYVVEETIDLQPEKTKKEIAG